MLVLSVGGEILKVILSPFLKFPSPHLSCLSSRPTEGTSFGEEGVGWPIIPQPRNLDNFSNYKMSPTTTITVTLPVPGGGNGHQIITTTLPNEKKEVWCCQTVRMPQFNLNRSEYIGGSVGLRK